MKKINYQKGAAGLAVFGIISLALLIVIYLIVQDNAPNSGNDDARDSAESVIRYTDAGFAPETITVSKGETVVFKNESSRAIRPASDVHPAHTAYPGSDIQKCGTAEADQIFDSCAAVPPGESWSFQFSEVGTWEYHDHLRPAETGAVVVK